MSPQAPRSFFECTKNVKIFLAELKALFNNAHLTASLDFLSVKGHHIRECNCGKRQLDPTGLILFSTHIRKYLMRQTKSSNWKDILWQDWLSAGILSHSASPEIHDDLFLFHSLVMSFVNIGWARKSCRFF